MGTNNTPTHAPSPGNAFLPIGIAVPPMRMPHLDFIYRIVCDMDSNISEIHNVDKTDITRVVLPILSGSVKGPRIEGKIVERSGADWAERVGVDKVGNSSNRPLTMSQYHQVQSKLISTAA